mgnify:CR=1 FL=1
MKFSYFEQQSFWHFFNPWVASANLWSHRELIHQFSSREVTGRYRGSFLGLFWSFVQPLVMLLTYTFIFGVIFKARWPGHASASLVEFATVLFCGMTAFGVFSECANRAPSLIVSNPNYVKKVVFPLEILPVSVLLGALFQGLVGLLMVVILNLAVNHVVHITLLFLPLVALPLCFFTLGASWVLASLGVFFRDLPHIMPLVTTVLFFLTPIFFSAEMVPPPYSTVMHFNPFSFIVESFRRVVLWGTMPNWTILGAGTLACAVFMFLGYAFFMRTKKGFADVV